ncbi:hypothetical protein [Caballeronia hypogeia]
MADVRYKNLHPLPQREDLYQLAAYVGRYGDEARTLAGALIHDTVRRT